ncbi:MAG: septal ring lytic transglycosylase RlpA family protein [Treponema sp.]|jgi:rare lipoprotein A|nr:septal ring lytic transglycosylase RlpA family protein [Treponema sp.]
MKRITVFLLIAGLSALGAQVKSAELSEGVFKQEGIASWYGPEFNGRPTASGEIFDSSRLTAAHPILPFGTRLKITNRNNNKAVVVRVNDRGPFVAARVIDISQAAAAQLDMLNTGTAPVSIESLDIVRLSRVPAGERSSAGLSAAEIPPLKPLQPAAAQPAAPLLTAPQVAAPPAASPIPQPVVTPRYPEAVQVLPGDTPALHPADTGPAETRPAPRFSLPARFKPAVPETETGKLYRIQVGSYKTPRNAVDAFGRLREAGLNPAYERYDDYYRVVLPRVKSEDLKAVAAQLGTAGFGEAILREEK